MCELVRRPSTWIDRGNPLTLSRPFKISFNKTRAEVQDTLLQFLAYERTRLRWVSMRLIHALVANRYLINAVGSCTY